MRQITAAVKSLLLGVLTAGLLFSTAVLAEPKGSFELPSTLGNITMQNVSVNGNCAGRNGDIGVNTQGQILTCQNGSWKVAKAEADLRLASCNDGSTYHYGCDPYCPAGYRLVSKILTGRNDPTGYCSEAGCGTNRVITGLCQR